MMTRRDFLAEFTAAAIALNIKEAPGQDGATSSVKDSIGVSRHVNVMIGTGGHGHTYPGATVPFGMVQLSPDTFNQGWDWCSGYHHSDSSIMGFSHTHLSGTGIGDMLDVLIMPGTGPSKLVPGPREHPEQGYRSRFRHEDEEATPGYYSVLLQDYGIRAELSATARAGIHRYTFPQSDSSHFIVDLSHIWGGDPATIDSAEIKVAAADTVVGSRTSSVWAKGRQIHFALKLSKAFRQAELFTDDHPVSGSAQQVSGKNVKCILHYRTSAGEKVLIKVGISAVSVEGALRNLESEIAGWDFAGVRLAAAQQWEAELSKIQINGGSLRQRQIFYTALYHTMLAPTLFDDVDGRYRGMDGQIHQLHAGQHNYSTYSLWDTYRALHPLFTLIQPERVPDFVNCLIRMAEESPVGMPVWPLQGCETKCMTGYHSAVVIAEAIAKNFPGIDIQRAYAAMRREAFDSSYQGLDLYRKNGYIPCDLMEESIGKSLDYAYNDWAVSHVASIAGASEDAALLRARSNCYKNLFDPASGFIRPKMQDGAWATPFAPSEIGHSSRWRDYTESNAWQATFAVQHDPLGLAELLGGRQGLEKKLDAIFDADPTLPPDAPIDIAGLIGQYAHGNEPSHHIAYLYVYAGAPYKTQERVAELMEGMYDNQPDGLAGNEDCGQMSAWFVMSAMGFYSVDPVSATYVFGTPLFQQVSIRLAQGKVLELAAKQSSPYSKYIASVTWNGNDHPAAWFRHAEIAGGGRFEFTMAHEPAAQFGRAAVLAPPSMSIETNSPNSHTNAKV